MARLNYSNRETHEIQITFRQDDLSQSRRNRSAQEIYGKGFPLFHPELDKNQQNFLDYSIRRFEITPTRNLNVGETKYPYSSNAFPSLINSNYYSELGSAILESFPTIDVVFNRLVNDNGNFIPYQIPAIGLGNGIASISRWKEDGTRSQSNNGNFMIGLGGTINKATKIQLSPFTRLKIEAELGRDHQSPKELSIDVDFKLFGFKIDTRTWITGPDPANYARTIVSPTGQTYYALNPFVNTPGTLDDTLTTQGNIGLTGSQVDQEWFQDLDSLLPVRNGDPGTSPYYTGPYYSQKYRLPKDYDTLSWDSENNLFRPRDVSSYVINQVVYKGPPTTLNVSSLEVGDSPTETWNKLSYIIDLIAPDKPDVKETGTWHFSTVAPTIGYPPSSMVVGSSITIYTSQARHTRTNLLIDWSNTGSSIIYATMMGTTGSPIGFWNDNVNWLGGHVYTSDWSTSSSTLSRTQEEANINAGNYGSYVPYTSSLINGTPTLSSITGPIEKRFVTSFDIVFNTGPALTNSLATGPANPFSSGTSLSLLSSNIFNKIWIQLWPAIKTQISSGIDPYYFRFSSYTNSSTPYQYGPGYRLFIDSSPITPTVSVVSPRLDIPVQNINWVSGVPTLGLNSTLRGAFRVDNFAKWFYPASTIASVDGNPAPNDGLPGANLSQTNSINYTVSTNNQYITGSFYQVDNSVGSLTDVIPNTYNLWQPITVQSGRWGYPFSMRTIAKSYSGSNHTFNVISPTGPSEIIVDTVSDNNNSVSVVVTSGDSSSSYPTYNSAAHLATNWGFLLNTQLQHQQVLTSGFWVGELQLYRNRYRWPQGNWSNLIPIAGPNYSSVFTPALRWKTFRVTTGLVSVTSVTTRIRNFSGSLTFNTNNEITNPSPSNFQIQCCIVNGGVQVTNWFDLNKVITVTPINNGDGCLFATGSVLSGSDLIRIISFGPSPKTGDLYVRVGFSSSILSYMFERVSL